MDNRRINNNSSLCQAAEKEDLSELQEKNVDVDISCEKDVGVPVKIRFSRNFQLTTQNLQCEVMNEKCGNCVLENSSGCGANSGYLVKVGEGKKKPLSSEI